MRGLCATIGISLLVLAVMADAEMDISKLSGPGKKFFTDMTKKMMGVPSLKPENIAAQAFFRDFLDRYTKLDDKVKQNMLQHVPKATKLFDAAAKRFNVNPMDAFKMMSTFFETFKKNGSGAIAQQGMKLAQGLFNKNKNNA